MASTDDILKQARALGDLIAQHDTVKKLSVLLEKLQQDTDAQRALTDYNRHLQTLGEKEAAGKPIEVEDKRKLESLQAAVVRNAVLRDFQVAQMDYLDLMRRVDEAVQGQTPAAAAGVASPEPG